jgi:hypothetical protein
MSSEKYPPDKWEEVKEYHDWMLVKPEDRASEAVVTGRTESGRISMRYALYKRKPPPEIPPEWGPVSP